MKFMNTKNHKSGTRYFARETNIHVTEFREILSLGSTLKFVEEFTLIYLLSSCYC
jgi:hypothetical protein